MDSRFYSQLKSGLLWLAFSLTLTLTSCQANIPETASPAETQAPAFSLPASDGSTVSLSDLAGQPVLLYFHMANG